jgi:hypothetical protein
VLHRAAVSRAPAQFSTTQEQEPPPGNTGNKLPQFLPKRKVALAVFRLNEGHNVHDSLGGCYEVIADRGRASPHWRAKNRKWALIRSHLWPHDTPERTQSAEGKAFPSGL